MGRSPSQFDQNWRNRSDRSRIGNSAVRGQRPGCRAGPHVVRGDHARSVQARTACHTGKPRAPGTCPRLIYRARRQGRGAAKFGQHGELTQYLLSTRSRVLVEASSVDRVWGIGPAANPAATQAEFTD
ncbi:NADAR family protein [Nocardia pseudovaccinii]|uniref:NADAR family protein n=1 Tax=Nocardia pseudovaccinii TaxID=189540 RepID=UPI003D90E800